RGSRRSAWRRRGTAGRGEGSWCGLGERWPRSPPPQRLLVPSRRGGVSGRPRPWVTLPAPAVPGTVLHRPNCSLRRFGNQPAPALPGTVPHAVRAAAIIAANISRLLPSLAPSRTAFPQVVASSCRTEAVFKHPARGGIGEGGAAAGA